MSEILANLDDINSALLVEEGDVAVTIVATDENTEKLQISASRIVRGYLANSVDNVTLQSWRTPEQTPEIIREIAGLLIASQLFFNQTAGQSTEIAERHYAQILYDRAMFMLNQIIDGALAIVDVELSLGDRMSLENFWPVDDTDRAFTMGMNL